MSQAQAAGASAPVAFHLDIPQTELDDLHRRLRNIRLPEDPTVPDGAQGIRPQTVAELCYAWLETHDWRALEAELNGIGQFKCEIMGLDIHFLHARSPRPDARPLLISHGWPSNVVEALDLIPLLVDPPADQPAFHVIVPSLPGFGFSGKPTEPGWGIERIADAWAALMVRLGYDRFLATGGDWGAMITTLLAVRHPRNVAMMHTCVPWVLRPESFADSDFTEQELGWQRELAGFRLRGGGRSAINATRPQSLAYGLTDSPAGHLAWILDGVLHGGTDTDDHGVHLVSRKRMLDNVALSWFARTDASSARLYWESLGKMDMTTPVTTASAVSVFPKEIQKLPRAWVERRYVDLRHWNLLPRGGHWAMAEVPESYASEMRLAFAQAPA